MTKREEAIEGMARAICRRTCPHIGGPDCETLVTGKPNWVFHKSEAEVAFDAVIGVLMEPSEEMISAVREWSMAELRGAAAVELINDLLREAAK